MDEPWKLDWVLTMLSIVAAVVVVIVIIAVLYNTGQANGEITQRLASECITAGGTWITGTSGGCIR